MTQVTKNILLLVASTLVGFGMMWWIYRDFNVDLLLGVFGQRANYVWIVLTLAVGLLANVLRSFRWRMLLRGAAIEVSLRHTCELDEPNTFLTAISF